MQGFFRLGLVLTALWLTLLAIVGSQEVVTGAKFSQYFTEYVEIGGFPGTTRNESESLAKNTEPKDSDLQKTLRPNPDDYFGKPKEPKFQFSAFLFWLIAPVVGLWITILALIPSISWIIRGFTRSGA